MVERNLIVVAATGGGKRMLTDEEWKQVNQLIDDGKIVITSHQDELEKKFNELFKDDLIKMHKVDESFMREEKDSNQYWKKSKQRNHPALRRKKR